MQPENVFQKSPKGREEIEKRTTRIDARRRTLLILVDGRTNARAIVEKAAHIPDGMVLLQALWTEGYIEPIGAASGAFPAPRQLPAGALPPAGLRSLDDLKRVGGRAIIKLMGPDGDSLALRLERAATTEAFFAEAQKAREALRSFLGPRQAEEFWKSLD